MVVERSRGAGRGGSAVALCFPGNPGLVDQGDCFNPLRQGDDGPRTRQHCAVAVACGCGIGLTRIKKAGHNSTTSPSQNSGKGFGGLLTPIITIYEDSVPIDPAQRVLYGCALGVSGCCGVQKPRPRSEGGGEDLGVETVRPRHLSRSKESLEGDPGTRPRALPGKGYGSAMWALTANGIWTAIAPRAVFIIFWFRV